MGEGGSSAAAPSFAAACSWGRGRARKKNMSNFSPRSADSRDLFRAAGPVGARASAPGLRARLRHATYERVHLSSLDGTPDRYPVRRREGAKDADKGALGALKSPSGHCDATKSAALQRPAKRALP